jgi:O-antigen/teichoic acid export membrane protein
MSEQELEVQRHGTMYLISLSGITIIGFLATIFYAHWVGAAVLGTYFLFLSMYSILSFFTDLGINYATTQRICEGKDQDFFYSAGFAIRAGAFLLLTMGLILFQYRFADLNEAGLFWILIGILGLGTIQSCVSMAIGASNRLGLAATTSLINNLVRILIQVITVFLGYQVYGLIGGLVAGLCVQLIIDAKYVDYYLRKFQWTHVKSILSFSSWAVLISAGTILFDNIPLILIAYFLPVSEVGIFGVCWTFSFFALFISIALINTLYVKVSRWNAQKDQYAITQSLSRATTYSLIFALPILSGSILLGYNLLYYLYGASFSAGANTLVIIIAMRVIQSILNLYTNFLMATDHAKQAVVGIITGVSANIILCIILIPHIGIVGAAIGAFVNVIISVFIARTYLSYIIPLDIEKTTIMHIVLATIIMTISLLILKWLPLNQSAFQTILMVLIGATIYFLVLLKVDNQIRDDSFRTLKITWILK